ncbi:MAG: hypothetical protein A2204_01580 [Elusimicrobia bacterium RIFOXYA1_FULL_47_7]|nr:MAG: hypothetical protein A2204_01580 [Elusimicrobia bacterium RIFOXYA1_FULL_47_7]
MKNLQRLYLSVLCLVILFSRNVDGTIIVALGLRDGIVVAADSRVTYSVTGGTLTYFYDTAEKLILIDDCVVALCGLISVEHDDLVKI